MDNILVDFTDIKLSNLVFNFQNEKFMPQLDKSYNLKSYD